MLTDQPPSNSASPRQRLVTVPPGYLVRVFPDTRDTVSYNQHGHVRTRATIWQPPISYNRLATLSGLGVAHISRIFRGLRKPNTRTLRKLGVALNMDIYDLMRRLDY